MEKNTGILAQHDKASIQIEDEIDLREYIGTFLKYKWNIFFLTFLIGLLALVISFSLTPIYSSTTSILIESDKAKIISIEEVYGIGSANREYFQTQLGILKSRALAEKLVKKLNLTTNSEFSPAIKQDSPWDIRFLIKEWLPVSWHPPEDKKLSPNEVLSQTVVAVMKNLSINLERNTQLAKITFQSADPKLAARVPNELAEIYIENDLESRLQMTQKAASWLTERLEGLRKKLDASETTLQTYLEKHQLVDAQGVKSIATSQLNTMSDDLLAAKLRLSEANIVYKQVKALKGRPASSYESIPKVLSNLLVQRLKEVELDKQRKVSELSKRYGKKHPNMIAVQSELDSAITNTGKQIRKVIASIEKDYLAARDNVRILQGSMKQAEEKIQNISKKTYRLSALERDVETNRQLYNMFLKRFKETDVSQSHQSTVARVIDPAISATIPAKPKKNLIVLIATVLGFMFATMLAFLLEHLDNTIHTVEDVEAKLGILLLGILPKLKGKLAKRVQFSVLEDDKTQFAESIRTIRTGIMLSGLDNPHKVLLITSTIPGEGKTTFAINQALAIGQMKKTILIDADLRRPSIAKRLGLSIKTPGIAEVVSGEKTLEECIQKVEGLNTHFLLSGTIPPNPLELLSSKHFQNVLTSLENDYEQVVIDSAPAHAVSDALVLSKYSNALVYVVKADETPYPLVQSGLKRLQQIEAPILGVVLNQFDAEKASKNYYGKYGHYYKTYYGQYHYADT
ncbi:GumC family protein [Candidatus Venteria ishoeyi]|uniref:non-specific protein-tyrosine kinase n=1 Tax=Candidatus Venteria ishoeyi TaxID=1899563 RepID=A0A1H6FFZ1_9GAMM|nr:polysaccharide biosynthesis tyrosine autokinase [Candidatus Venteria ishoeyi]SEH08563.1 Tyrosine-protein kinase etk [Candidatus Venteria ishoeyi]